MPSPEGKARQRLDTLTRPSLQNAVKALNVSPLKSVSKYVILKCNNLERKKIMSESRILASVGGINITEAEVNESILSMGERGRSLMNPQGQKMVLDQLINRKLILAGARKELLEFDPEFKKQLALAKEELLTKFAISRAIENVKVTDEEAKKYYDENTERFNTGASVNASHILVDSEEKANEIRAEIESGIITFADAAKKYSSCPSKDNGGELGTFGRGQMVKEFEDAAFEMNVGEMSAPVKTQFGFHLILLNEKNESTVLAYEEIADQLREQLLSEKQQKAFTSRINQLKILFPVDIF